jgi:hypothetical protein
VAVIPIDGKVRVWWLTACANINAPTVAELNAGTALEGVITPDGLNITPSTGKVAAGNLGSTFSAERIGRRAFAISVKFHHDTVDTVWAMMPYRTSGFLAVRRGIDKATAPASTQKVEIYPVETGEPAEDTPQPDGSWDYTIEMALTSDAATRAVVA